MKGHLILILALLILGRCNINTFGDHQTDEMKAITTIVKLTKAESAYHARFKRYGTVSDLITQADRSLSPELLSVNSGYSFSLTVREGGFVVVAKPIKVGPGSRKSFFVDETSIVRYSWHPNDLNRDSPVLK